MNSHTFVLIAGAWHGAWCWQKIVPLLEAQGHRVRTPELPATGADTSDPAEVTLESWARFVAGIDRRGARTRDRSSDTAVAASSSAARRRLVPERMRRLVYLVGLSTARGRHAGRDRA